MESTSSQTEAQPQGSRLPPVSGYLQSPPQGNGSGTGVPQVLDVCCGGRMFWFDKHDPRALYLDKRQETHLLKNKEKFECLKVEPDMIADFTELPFPDDSFWHVIFDPPHRTTLTRESDAKTWLARRYGRLLGDWKVMLQQGFAECFRVLKPMGTLIFKWCEYDVPLAEILALTPEKPLYGHRSGNRGDTHWVAFIKGAVAPATEEYNSEVSDSRREKP